MHNRQTLDKIRAAFPALQQHWGGQDNATHTPCFFDGPGGSQISQSVLSAMTDYLGRYNANLGAPYFSSEKTMQVMADARQHVAALLNAETAEQIVFGATATNLMFHFSRAISRDWQAGDEIIVTALDHYSNVSSWITAAEEKGVIVHQIPVDLDTFDIDYQQLGEKLSNKTKLVAVTHASNTVGTIVDVSRVVTLAKTVGALTFVDAVHYAPHHLIDVQALDCDFLVISAYKFTGPHLAALYAKTHHLTNLKPYKVLPAADINPNRWEQGTQNFEAMAGLIACIQYLADLGDDESKGLSLRQRLSAGFAWIAQHESHLSQYFLQRLAEYPKITLYGKAHSEGRTPTFAFRLDNDLPRHFATFCGKRHLCIGDGNFYAQGLCEQLNLMDNGGVIRVGCLHYNTQEEIDFFFSVLDDYIQLS